MDAAEVQEIVDKSLQNFMGRLVQTIREEVVVKVREEVKNEIIINVVNEIRRNGSLLEDIRTTQKEMLASQKEMLEYQKVSDLQTHELLSNIAEILNRKLG